jgi:hypothetical protein
MNKNHDYIFRYYTGVGYGLPHNCLNCKYISGMMYLLCLKNIPPLGKHCGGNSVCDSWEGIEGNHV